MLHSTLHTALFKSSIEMNFLICEITIYLQRFSIVCSPINPSLLSFKFTVYSFINCYCMDICICAYLYIPKYNLFSPYNVTCMYIFRSDYLTLNKQLVCSAMGYVMSPTLSFLSLSVILCKVETLWSFLCPFWHGHWWCLFSAHVWSCWWDFIDVSNFWHY